MYFFLCNLAVLDIFYVSTILPKLLAITITGDKKISFTGCMTQLGCFIWCSTQELFLLAAMACDRYIAICIPLRYSQIMNKGLFIPITTFSGLFCAIYSLLHAVFISQCLFTFYKEINHFYCDVKTLVRLIVSDTRTMEVVIFVDDACVGFFPLLCILMSYIFIISTILKIHSSTTRLKVFSTCSSHLTVVLLSYGISLQVYAMPQSKLSLEKYKNISIFYVAIVPMLNPLVYSLRNKDVLKAIKKLIRVI
ncbi:hypothetical protein XELAEV_18018720mg [Xenopus laevis]|uniref:G-protein coupled receptors family 1 profile domain-containing protein n=1 Tax=Xenopus laevis TaxID=8355 RepID=A0A974DDN4_XENLA|nr:hypothetical protein XELAEV_18018720mg [Xenopus laevis]